MSTSAPDVPMVELRGVHKWFGHTHVLRGIDLVVPKGTVCTVLGPSGSGKSTALRCINQLEEIGAGRIYVDGVLAGYREGERGGRPTLFRLHPKEIARQRANVGMVFQRFNLFPHMTAAGNVAEAQVQVLGRSKDDARARAVAMLERVGLAHGGVAVVRGGQAQGGALAVRHDGIPIPGRPWSTWSRRTTAARRSSQTSGSPPAARSIRATRSPSWRRMAS